MPTTTHWELRQDVQCGLEVWTILMDGHILHTYMSYGAARLRYLSILQKCKVTAVTAAS